jgi:hypothetical protein
MELAMCEVAEGLAAPAARILQGRIRTQPGLAVLGLLKAGEEEDGA